MDAQRAHYGMAIEHSHQEPTKTLRDEFAMAALSGLLSANVPDKGHPPSSFALWAYHHADAMLAARKKES